MLTPSVDDGINDRLEAVRHCRWVDEVVAEAPWVIDEAFIKKYEIDYVAHDEDPYASGDHEDVYGYAKGLGMFFWPLSSTCDVMYLHMNPGKFIPTRRTPGVSTSELLERIVLGYRKRDFDDKLTKMGHAELRAEGSDYDSVSSSRHASRLASRSTSPTYHEIEGQLARKYHLTFIPQAIITTRHLLSINRDTMNDSYKRKDIFYSGFF